MAGCSRLVICAHWAPELLTSHISCHVFIISCPTDVSQGFCGLSIPKRSVANGGCGRTKLLVGVQVMGAGLLIRTGRL